MQTRLVTATAWAATLVGHPRFPPCPGRHAGAPAECRARLGDDHARHMRLEQKVGQLFVTTSTAVTPPDPSAADRAANRAVRRGDADQVIEQYHLGGIIYFAWSNSVDNPPQIATLSNGLQRAALGDGAGPGAAADLHRPGAGRGRPDRPARHPVPRATWRSAPGGGPGRPDGGARSTGRELRGDGHQPELRAGRRRQRQPGQPGDRRPLVRRRPAAGRRPHRRPGHRLPAGAGVAAAAKHFPGHGDTADRQPHRPPGDQPHPRGVGADRRAAVPGRHRRAASTRS